MIDKKAALSYLNDRLWSDEAGAYAEATTIPIYHRNDNTLARLVMRTHAPERAAILEEGLLKDYIDPRWCILYGDVDNFVPAQTVLPDFLRYADLVALQYFYQYLRPNPDAPPNRNLSFGLLTKLYGLFHEGHVFDMATMKEGYTVYKTLLFGMCAIRHNRVALAREILDRTYELFQIKEENELGELGGFKTEWLAPEWEDNPEYDHLLHLANCETTCLAILLQDEYDARWNSDALMIGAGSAGIAAGGIAFTHAITGRQIARW
jgi:hypothetical protein